MTSITVWTTDSNSKQQINFMLCKKLTKSLNSVHSVHLSQRHRKHFDIDPVTKWARRERSNDRRGSWRGGCIPPHQLGGMECSQWVRAELGG